MNRIVASVFAFAFFMSITVYSENGFAVIHDEDGHSNIRESANIKSEVVGKVTHGSIVFITEEKGDWPAFSSQT